MAFGGIAGAVGAYLQAKKARELKQQQDAQQQQRDALNAQLVRAQIAHMQSGDAATARANGTGVAPYPGATPAIAAGAGGAPPIKPPTVDPYVPGGVTDAPASTTLPITPAMTAAGPGPSTTLPAQPQAPTGQPTFALLAGQANGMLSKAQALEDEATYYDDQGATQVAARKRAQATAYRQQAKSLNDQAEASHRSQVEDIESGTQTLPTMPKNLTQIAPGNKGHAPKAGSIEDLQAGYNHASAIAAWFASGQGGDLRDPRVAAQGKLWEARAVQAAGQLKEAQIQQASADRESVRFKQEQQLHGMPTFRDLHPRDGGNGRGTKPADADTVNGAEAIIKKSPDPETTAQGIVARARLHGANQSTVDAIVNLGNYYAGKLHQRGPTKPNAFGALAP